MLFLTELLTPQNFTPEQFNTEKLILKISLTGTLDSYNSLELFIFIKIINEGGLNHILLNLNNLDDVDSSGIGVLIQSANLLRLNNGEIAMFKVPDKILKIFKVVKLDKLVKIFNSEDDSISYLKQNKR